MKKILSFLLLAAMLVGCLTPAFATMAADGPAIAISDTTYTEQGRPASVTADVTVSGNTGIASMTLLVYYKTADFTGASVSLDGSMFSETVSEVGNAALGSGPKYKSKLLNAGIEDPSQYKVISVTLYGLNELEEFVDVTTDGIACKAVLEMDTAAAVGSEHNYGVIITEATNAAGDEVAFGASTVAAKTTVVEDPYLGMYETFTMFLAGPSEITPDEKTVKFQLRMDGNHGLYGTRICFAYDAALELVSMESSGMWEYNAENPIDGEFMPGSEETNFNALNPDPIIVSAFDYFKTDITGKRCTLLYIEKAGSDLSANVYDNGVIATLTFKIADTAQPGDTFRIDMAYPEEDPTIVVEDPDKGFVGADTEHLDMIGCSFKIAGGECAHDGATHEEIVTEATCTVAGSKNTICDLCGEIVSTVEIPAAGHVNGDKVVTSEPTYEADGAYEIRCTVCNEVVESGAIPKLTRAAITVGTGIAKPGKTVTIPVNIADNAGMFITRMSVAYDAAKLEFVSAENGDVFTDATNVLFTKVEDGNLTLYFEAAADADVVGDGVLANLTFNVVDDEANVGETPVSIVVEDAINFAGEDVAVISTDGAVSIVANTVVSAATAEVEINKSVAVPVSISTNGGIWGLRAEISYDAALLTFNGIDSGLFNAVEGENYSVENGVITIFAEGAEIADVAEDGALFTLKFTAGAATGTSAIDINILDAINAEGQDLDVKAVSGAVEVIPCKHEACTEQVTVEPTVDAEGEKIYVCDNCGETVRTEAIAKLAGLTIGAVEVSAADAISVPVTMTTNPGVYSINMEIAYDDTKLTFTGITSGLFEAIEGESYSVENGVITVFVENTEVADLVGDGVAFSVNFTTENADGEYVIDGTLIPGSTVNVNSEEVAFTVVDGSVKVTHVCDYEWVVTKEATEEADGEKQLVCKVCGDVSETVVIPRIVFLTKASANEYAASVTLDGSTITVVANKTATEYVKFAIGYNEGTTFTADSLTAATVKSTWAYVIVDFGTTAGKLTVTNADGLVKEYNVVIQYADYPAYTVIGPGYTVDRVDDQTEAENIYVYAKAGMNNATLMLDIPAVNEYTCSEGLTTVVNGTKVYFKALSTAASHDYTITITTPMGEKVYTVHYVFDVEVTAGVKGGSMVDACVLEGDTVNITVSDTYAYASFRYIFDNINTEVVYDDALVDCVMAGSIHWFKIYNDGTGAVTTKMTATNTVTGATREFTVNVTFGSNG